MSKMIPRATSPIETAAIGSRASIAVGALKAAGCHVEVAGRPVLEPVVVGPGVAAVAPPRQPERGRDRNRHDEQPGNHRECQVVVIVAPEQDPGRQRVERQQADHREIDPRMHAIRDQPKRPVLV
jgi:hypothetical protein